MAEGSKPPRRRKAAAPPPPPASAPDLAPELLLDTPVGAPRTPSDYEPLVTALGGMLDFPAMLAIADILPVMVAYYDRDLIFRFINRPFAEWLEIPRKDILGKHASQIIGDKAFAERAPMIAQALAGQRTFFAAEFDHPSRGPVALQSDYVPWADSGGETRGIIVVVQEVTGQRVAEKAVIESEARFRRIANSAPAMMWVTRLDRVRDFVNDHYVEFTGGTVEDARMLDWRTRIHPDDVDRIVAESIAGEASGQAFTLEGRYLRADGEYRWLRSVSQPRFGADGELVGFIGVASDITLAKQAELDLKGQVAEQNRELALSEARFRAVFDTVLEVLVLMEPDGTVVELNRKDAPWRAKNARDAVGLKIWDTPTLQLYLSPVIGSLVDHFPVGRRL